MPPSRLPPLSHTTCNIALARIQQYEDELRRHGQQYEAAERRRRRDMERLRQDRDAVVREQKYHRLEMFLAHQAMLEEHCRRRWNPRRRNEMQSRKSKERRRAAYDDDVRQMQAAFAVDWTAVRRECDDVFGAVPPSPTLQPIAPAGVEKVEGCVCRQL